MKRLGDALAQLDATSRALLDLNMRRGMDEGEIGELLSVDAGEVASRREKILDGLADELQLEPREDRDELRATLPDLPAQYWNGKEEPAAGATTSTCARYPRPRGKGPPQVTSTSTG